ncbi:ABC transporter ATPase [Brachybacterium phenoliresistens]|uniref:ABC transporter ATPase n=1 Tax=Brachybacterium phenoliresistens TaxID=396014 RepID=Z9JNT0_9MICO|nr:ATP-binding cassette domain-containing protein [Brachybacterium phenoliresistens]EWS79849.1 ABC transporter ATPase [Brachybacterium phenoliresistens]
MSERVLELQGVKFHRGDKQILAEVDLEVRAGEHWALLGPNGAGKSTLLSFCGAREFPSRGTVDVLGRRMGRVAISELHREIGHVNPRHPLDVALSIRQVVLTGLTGTIDLPPRWEPSPEQLARADRLVAGIGLADRSASRWPVLSQGERGRALVARALIGQPRLLLLDEPTTGLDLAAREQLLDTLDALAHEEPDVATVLVTHHLEELPESTTHAVLLAHGRILAAGPVAEVLTSQAVSAAFAHPIEVRHDEGRWSARALRHGRGLRA